MLNEDKLNSVIDRLDKQLVDNGLRIDGGGLIVIKMDKMIELLDKRVAFLLAMQEKKLDRIIQLLEKGFP